MCNASEVWKIQSDKNMENSLLKVTVSAWGTLVMVTLILEKRLSSSHFMINALCG